MRIPIIIRLSSPVNRGPEQNTTKYKLCAYFLGSTAVDYYKVEWDDRHVPIIYQTEMISATKVEVKMDRSIEWLCFIMKGKKKHDCSYGIYMTNLNAFLESNQQACDNQHYYIQLVLNRWQWNYFIIAMITIEHRPIPDLQLTKGTP